MTINRRNPFKITNVIIAFIAVLPIDDIRSILCARIWLSELIQDYWGKVDTDAVGVLAQDKSTRIWLDLMLRRSLKKCVDWSRIDKNAYLEAMRHSVVDPAPIKALLQGALTDKIDDRETFMKGIDYSYYYEQTE